MVMGYYKYYQTRANMVTNKLLNFVLLPYLLYTNKHNRLNNNHLSNTNNNKNKHSNCFHFPLFTNILLNKPFTFRVY